MTNDVEFNQDNWDAVERCVCRFAGMTGNTRIDRVSLIMDLMAADGVNGNPAIDWTRLYSADDFNFAHDVGGIHRHMNRETGELGGCFLPRFTKRNAGD
jgi:hypothetical protein